MIKKILSISLALTLSLGIFAGCSNKKDESSTNSTSTDPLTKAEQVLERVKSGEDFDKLIKEFGEDPGMQQNVDGYLFTKNEMVKPFEDAAFALKDNEVSDIVETDFGYHIIKRIAFNDYYKIHKDEVNTKYYQAQYSNLINKDIEAVKVVFADGYDKINVTKFDDFKAENIMTVDGIQVPTKIYRHFFLNLKIQADNGDDTYWTTNADKVKNLKESVEYYVKRYYLPQTLGKKYNVSLNDEDLKAVDASLSSAVDQAGGQEKYQEFLTGMYIDADSYKFLQQLVALDTKIYTEIIKEGKELYASEDTIKKYFADSYVVAKHILIAKPDKDENNSSIDSSSNTDSSSLTDSTKK